MPITIDGTGTIAGISAGGLNDGIITQPELATGVAGTGPAFFAGASSPTACANGVTTKILFQSELFDTANCFDTTNSRFTPNVSGYYQVNFAIYINAMTSLYGYIFIRKNGTDYAYGSSLIGNAGGALASGSCLVDMNGTTDYLEVYAVQLTGVTLNSAGVASTNFFNAFMARAT
jgi:hypothetical protein